MLDNSQINRILGDASLLEHVAINLRGQVTTNPTLSNGVIQEVTLTAGRLTGRFHHTGVVIEFEGQEELAIQSRDLHLRDVVNAGMTVFSSVLSKSQ